MNNRKRNKQINFRVTEQEFIFFNEKYKESGLKNLSQYFRKLAAEGVVVNVDNEPIKNIATQLNKIGGNINQIARMANFKKEINTEDLKDVERKLGEIWHTLQSIQSTLR